MKVGKRKMQPVMEKHLTPSQYEQKSEELYV